MDRTWGQRSLRLETDGWSQNQAMWIKVHMTVKVSPSVELRSYVLYAFEYEKGAAAAGLEICSGKYWYDVSLSRERKAGTCSRGSLDAADRIL